MKPCRSLYAVRQSAVCPRGTGRKREEWVYVPELINLPPFRVQPRHPPGGPLRVLGNSESVPAILSSTLALEIPLSTFSVSTPFLSLSFSLARSSSLSPPLWYCRHPRGFIQPSRLKPPPASGQSFPLMEVR